VEAHWVVEEVEIVRNQSLSNFEGEEVVAVLGREGEKEWSPDLVDRVLVEVQAQAVEWRLQGPVDSKVDMDDDRPKVVPAQVEWNPSMFVALVPEILPDSLVFSTLSFEAVDDPLQLPFRHHRPKHLSIYLKYFFYSHFSLNFHYDNKLDWIVD
jgi:hypothetical protein